MTRARDLSNDEANNGGATPPFVAGKNFLINGGFDVWQRGTTINAATHSTYTADQWVMVNDSVGTVNVTRQTIADQGINATYAMRVEKSAGANNRVVMVAVPEGALNCIGKTVTFSGYLRKGSALTSNVTIDIGTRATRYGTQYDGATSIAVSNASLSTSSFTRFSTTFTVTSATSTNNANLFEVEIRFDQAGGSNVYLEFAAMQVEVGSVATPFSRAGGTTAGELAACQRYYFRITGGSGYQPVCNGFATSSTNVMGYVQYPVQMRTTPTAIEYSTLQCNDSTIGTAVSAVAFSGTEVGPYAATLNFTCSSMTTYRHAKVLQSNSASGYLALTAEV
jgi:hypothetical protein